MCPVQECHGSNQSNSVRGMHVKLKVGSSSVWRWLRFGSVRFGGGFSSVRFGGGFGSVQPVRFDWFGSVRPVRFGSAERFGPVRFGYVDGVGTIVLTTN